MPSNTFANSGPSLIGHTLDNGRLEFLSVLGLGAYGVVYLAIDLHAPTPVYLAVKCLLRAGLDSRQRHFQRREIALHQLASRHPNVVTLHKVIEEGDYVFVIMDFCDEGDLFGMITEKQRYVGDDMLIKSVFLQIVDAVEYCHSMGIFHRDLKPENILCTRDGERICIADFGLATSEKTSTDFGCGSTFYLSPECQGGLFERLDNYNTATNDLWSLGVILVNLTCGRNPWRQACPSDETFRAFVHNPNFLRTILPISKATNRILKALFALDPAHRPSLAELRREVAAVDTFTMTDDELRVAHSAARAAAATIRPVPPALPKIVVPAPLPVEQMQVDAEEERYYDPRYTRVGGVVASQVVQVINNQDQHCQDWSANVSASSAFAIDSDIINHIDFTHHQASGANQAQIVAAQHPIPQPIAIPRGKLEQQQQRQSNVNVVDYDNDSYNMLTTSSQSSSSGDGDVSLPPTPEFNPADKAQVAPVSPRWNMAQVAGQQVKRPDLLHVNSVHINSALSPITDFSLI